MFICAIRNCIQRTCVNINTYIYIYLNRFQIAYAAMTRSTLPQRIAADC